MEKDRVDFHEHEAGKHKNEAEYWMKESEKHHKKGNTREFKKSYIRAGLHQIASLGHINAAMAHLANMPNAKDFSQAADILSAHAKEPHTTHGPDGNKENISNEDRKVFLEHHPSEADLHGDWAEWLMKKSKLMKDRKKSDSLYHASILHRIAENLQNQAHYAHRIHHPQSLDFTDNANNLTNAAFEGHNALKKHTGLDVDRARREENRGR